VFPRSRIFTAIITAILAAKDRHQQTVTEGKKSGRGVGQRMAALRDLVDVAAALEEAPARIPLDDLLDALACAWTARRWSTGDAMSLPCGVEEYDARGLRMRIVA
jgi:predicted RNase H-like nuclease